MRILLLGGTGEASLLAQEIAARGIDAVFSYAGCSENPNFQPLPTRSGGFGGAEGLGRYLRTQGITHVVDATHPFARRISANAAIACQKNSVLLCVLERPPWPLRREWHVVDSVAGAAASLPESGARVFVALGRRHTGAFGIRPSNFYLFRFIEWADHPPDLPDAAVVVGRGPFAMENEKALLQQYRINRIVARNGGSKAATAKFDAAREMGIKVTMIIRPGENAGAVAVMSMAGAIGNPCKCTSTEEVISWIARHSAADSQLRGA